MKAINPTKKIHALGFPTIIIKKSLWGFYPIDVRYNCQTSIVRSTSAEVIRDIQEGRLPKEKKNDSEYVLDSLRRDCAQVF